MIVVIPHCLQDGKYGVVSMCTGTGMGAAAVFEYETGWGEGK